MQIDIDSVITTINTAVAETASEIRGKHRQKKKPWVTAEILDLCDKRRELRKREQCSEIEENLRKNNSKRAYQLVKDLATVKQGKATTVQDHSGKCLTEE